MIQAVVFGLPDDPKRLWIADLEAGTVKPMDSATGDLAKVAELRRVGVTVIKNLDFALGVPTAKAAFSGHVEP